MTKDTLNFSVSSSDSTPTVSGQQTEIGSQRVTIDVDFPAGSADVDYPVAFTAAGVQSIVLVSTKNLTIKVNSTSTPILTINLIAGTPYVWQRSPGYFANPFSADVAHFYCSCSAATNLRGKILKA